METATGCLRACALKGRLSLDQAAALADAAIACGNGASALQPGQSPSSGTERGALPDLHARLEDSGLIDVDPEIEPGNIVASPLDDLDPEALLNLNRASARWKRAQGGRGLAPIAGQVQLRLRRACRLPLNDVEADIRFEASTIGRSRLFLAGDDALAAQCARPRRAMSRAARFAFLALAGAGETAPRRMRALVDGQAPAPCLPRRIARQRRGAFATTRCVA